MKVDTSGLKPTFVQALWAPPGKVIAYNVGMVYLTDKGYYVAAAAYDNALWGNTKWLVRRMIKNAIRKVPEVRSKALALLKGVKSNTVYRKDPKALDFTIKKYPDLFYAVGHASFSIIGIKRGKKWKLSAIISDRYDFDNVQSYKSISGIANNIGLVMQSIKYIKPYKWTVFIPLTI